MPNTLAAKSCTPCRGGIPPLTIDEAQVLPGAGSRLGPARRWPEDPAHLPVQELPRGAGLRAEAGELAEAEGHHPDIAFGWGYATVSLQTKKIKGLHENDFIMAAKLDGLSSP